MSTKTTFKRIALVAVAALGLGVLSVAPSSAAVTVISDTLTVSATSATIAYGETATITITEEFTSTIANSASTAETATVNMVRDSAGTAQNVTVYSKLTSDSANTSVAVAPREVTWGTTLGSSVLESIIPSAAGAYTKNTITVKFYNSTATTTGTTRYTITTRAADGTISKVAYFDLTTTGNVATGSAAKSLAFVSDSYTTGVAFTNRTDSALVVSAGTAASPAFAGFIIPEFRNSSDTKTAASGAAVNDSMTIVVSGPGLLTTQSSRTMVAGVSTKAKSVTFSQGDTVVVWSDGTAGVGTYTASIGGVNITQAAKTITFVGKPSTITAKVESVTVANSGTAAGAISFTVADSAGNAVKTTSLMNTGTPGGLYAVWADTKVASGSTVAETGSTAQYAAATYNSTASRWEVSFTMLDSGTVSVVIADSYTAASAVAKSSAVTLTSVGAGYKGSITSDKSTYVVGEKAMLTLTQTDYYGRNVLEKTTTSAQLGSPYWASAAPSFGDDSSAQAVGGHFSGSLITYLSAASYYGGVDTVSVYMPTTAGTYTLMSVLPGATTASQIWTFTVTDPTKDAADAATDAALEATDAAYAAQDAAQLAAEAADAATAAAEAATAAVEDLATQVASLFADLQKQITTLANVVAKIAKKVKA